MKTINKKFIFLLIITLLAGMGLGRWFFGGQSVEVISTPPKAEGVEQIWTCSMHPQIRQNEPGQCPLCGMDLIPLVTDSDGVNATAIEMSPAAMKLAEVQTAKVQRQTVIKQTRLNGKITPDERFVFAQSAHFSGRIEQLLINYTGAFVSQGQLLAYIYSPALISAQEELLSAYKMRETQPQLYQAAKDKLLHWKLSADQIAAVIEEGQPIERFPIYADVSGVVLKKNVEPGDYMEAGHPLFVLSDLSKLWILFEVYERDMAWVHEGDNVVFQVASLPGESFNGKITFMDPVLNPLTRVAMARVELSNSKDKLKPEMYVQGVVTSRSEAQKDELLLPKSAVMWTGVNSVVYVKENNTEKARFNMRKVTLGPSLGDSFVVLSGLEEGEEIAVYGTFSIDAAAQLAGKPSMMNQEGGASAAVYDQEKKQKAAEEVLPEVMLAKDVSPKAKKALQALFGQYIQLKDALVADDFDTAMKEARLFNEVLLQIDRSWFEERGHSRWMTQSEQLTKDITMMLGASEIESARSTFISLSVVMIEVAQTFRPLEQPLYVQHCPMANSNQGADWMSLEKDIENPYFGAMMLKCGEVKQEIQ